MKRALTHRCAIKEETIALNPDWVYNQACRLPHNIHSISHSVIMLNDLFKLIMKRRLSNDSFELIKQITIKYWLYNALLQKSFQASIVFNDQLIVSWVEFRKCCL